MNRVEGGEAGPRGVREIASDGALPLFVHPEWRARFPWLCQGTTGAGGRVGEPFDLRLFRAPESGKAAARGRVAARWRALGRETGFERVIHARQVHGSRVALHPPPAPGAPPGLALAGEGDGHATEAPGLLLTVATADCVPISVVAPGPRAVMLLHAGWRGAAAGILEEGLGLLERRFAAEPASVHLHLGPSICGACYEVGPEVFEALGLEPPAAAAPLDLRRVLAERARRLGVRGERTTLSAFCTRCGGSPFFSHRGGDEGRQVGFLGIRPEIGGEAETDGPHPA